jgi:NAD(P)-dependent dehydrogenase (short-subunit alcohol dehydrogenase family)
MAILDSFRLNGKVALVTGGAGLFGRQIVRAVAEAGAKVFVASRDLHKLKQQANVFSAEGLDVTPLTLHQASEESIRAVLDEIIKQAGKIDILVNNAVLRTMRGWTCEAHKFAESMAVNATGLFAITRTFGDYMAAHGGGSIINVGSIQGCVGPDFTLYDGLNLDTPPDYFFHKGGLLQLTRYAASKLGPKGVRVNAISPGGFLSGQSDAFVARYAARTFLGRMANETDLAGIIVFLASDASAYITGANIPVDGGYTAK